MVERTTEPVFAQSQIRRTAFCEQCPVAKVLGESPSGNYRVRHSDFLGKLTIENPATESVVIVQGLARGASLEDVVNYCERPIVTSRKILPDKLSCRALEYLRDLPPDLLHELIRS